MRANLVISVSGLLQEHVGVRNGMRIAAGASLLAGLTMMPVILRRARQRHKSSQDEHKPLLKQGDNNNPLYESSKTKQFVVLQSPHIQYTYIHQQKGEG